MPDHLHCLWTLPVGDNDYPMRWRLIKTMVTQCCRARLEAPEIISPRRLRKNQSSLWQNRYWEHQIRDAADFARHIDYIHFNRVKHGLVQHVADWPYSSFHRYVKNRIFPMHRAGNDKDGDFGE